MTEKTYTPPPISGYRTLTQTEVDAMNSIKEMGNSIGTLIDMLGGLDDVDARWLAIAKTDLQKGFMALTRAVAKPTGF